MHWGTTNCATCFIVTLALLLGSGTQACLGGLPCPCSGRTQEWRWPGTVSERGQRMPSPDLFFPCSNSFKMFFFLHFTPWSGPAVALRRLRRATPAFLPSGSPSAFVSTSRLLSDAGTPHSRAHDARVPPSEDVHLRSRLLANPPHSPLKSNPVCFQNPFSLCYFFLQTYNFHHCR